MSTKGDLAGNKKLVEDFCRTFYNAKDYDSARSMLAGDFNNHHPGAGIGPQRTIDSFQEQVASKFPEFFLEVRRTVAEDDYVWTYGLVTFAPEMPRAIAVGIWRIVDGLLAEHWDVGQQISEDMTSDTLLTSGRDADSRQGHVGEQRDE